MSELEIQTKVAVLERDVNQFANVIQKLDQNIEKLTDVSQTVKQLLAMHETRLDSQERKTDDAIEEMNEEVVEITRSIEKLEQDQLDKFKEVEDKFEDIHKKFDQLDKMKWIIIGIVAAVGILFKVDIQKVLAIF